jgi:hypothetical protein
MHQDHCHNGIFTLCVGIPRFDDTTRSRISEEENKITASENKIIHICKIQNN